jgi:hypothetical protein
MFLGWDLGWLFGFCVYFAHFGEVEFGAKTKPLL